jgi:ketosteroid isomerase-like protein
MKQWIYSIFLMCFISACSVADQQAVEDIHAVMDAQSDAWNRGDIPAYMEGYWKDEQLQFSGGNTITFGHAATLHRYEERYPDKATMGTLQFIDLRTQLLSNDAAFTTGAWHLDRAQDDRSGRFTLVWRKIRGQWRIVADHSS